MKKRKRFVFLGILVLVICGMSVQAMAQSTDTDRIFQQQSENFHTQDVEDAVPESALEFAGEDKALTLENTDSFLNISEWFSLIVRCFFSVLSEKRSMLVQIAAILILMYAVRALCSGMRNEKTMEILNYFVIAVSAVLVLESVFFSAQHAVSAMGEVAAFSNATLPVLTALVSASGYPASAAAVSASVIFSLDIIAFVASYVVPTLINSYMALGIGAGLSSNENLKSISAFLRKTVVFVITLLFCLLIGVLSLKSGLSTASDSISRRTAVFTAGNFIPIAGNYLGEGINLVFSCAGVLKNTVGTFSVLVLLFTVSGPVIEILVNYILLSIAKMFCSFFDNKNLLSFFEVIRDAFSMMLSMTIGLSVILIIAITLITRIGG